MSRKRSLLKPSFSAELKSKMKSVGVIAAAIGALAAILAAVIGGFFLLVQPVWTRMVDEYFNYTADINVVDVAGVRTGDKRALDIVLHNPSGVNQAVVLVEVAFHQEGAPLAMIAKSIYELQGDIAISVKDGNSKGSIGGAAQPEAAPSTLYTMTGTWERTARGEWTVILRIPVREELKPGEHRSIVVVLPTTLRLGGKTDTMFGVSDQSKYISENPPEFKLVDFLRDAGESDLRVLVKRGDGKKAGAISRVAFSR